MSKKKPKLSINEKNLSKIALKTLKLKHSTNLPAKKSSASPSPSCCDIRQRKHIQVLDPPDGFEVPYCSHGPCLFFGDDKNRRWFSCAVYRSNKCSFRIDVPRNLDLFTWKNPEPARCECHYGSLRKKLSSMNESKDSTYFCQKCFDFVHLPHKDPVKGPIEAEIFPSKLLAPLEEDQGEAQYWFSDESLQVLENVINREDFDSILCIGSPTVFEQFYESRRDLNRFLLDVDCRFAQFYQKSEFAQYSMLVHHFYDDESKLFFENFLQKAQRLIIVCDPPFGAFIEALMKSIDAIESQFTNSSSAPKTMKTMLILPVFVGKHVLKRPKFSMIDFKLTYTNHKQFKDPNKTIVRIFTDILPSSFILPDSDYKYCQTCQRYVCKTNVHCNLCETCPSKDGSTYKHCNVCQKCVKPTYVHCKNCSKCHLKDRCL